MLVIPLPRRSAAGRYHLYVATACPWAARCLATLYLKGLQGAIGLSIVHPTWQRTRPEDPEDRHEGWAFRSPGDPPVSNPDGYGSFTCERCVPDDVNQAKFVRDLYGAYWAAWVLLLSLVVQSSGRGVA